MSAALVALLLTLPSPSFAQADSGPPVPPAVRSRRAAVVSSGPGTVAAGLGGGTPTGPAADRAPQSYVPPNTFDIGSFHYTDPNDPDFQPLGDTSFTALRSDETLLIPDGTGSYPNPRREDYGANHTLGSSVDHGAGGFALQSAAAGDVFGDGRELAVTVSRRTGADVDRLNMRIWDRDAQGNMAAIRSLDTIYTATDRVEIACGDLDADGRDEVALVALVGGSRRLLVFEDALDNGWTIGGLVAPALERDLGTVTTTLVEIGELDGDAADEIVTMSVTSATHDIRVHDDLAAGLVPLADTLFSAGTGSSAAGVYLRAVDHDGDGIDAVAHFSRELLLVAEVDLATATLTPFGSGRSFTSGCPIALTVQDPVGLGEESLVALRTGYIPGPFNFNTVTYSLVRQRQDTAGNWSSTVLFYDSSRENQRPVECQMVAVDDDRDGREELQVVVGHQLGWTNNQFAPRAIRLAFDENGALRRWQAIPTFASYSLGARTFAFVGGDDDGETVTVRWTGQKEVVLSDPMPVVVMEAVPTKAGIAQNYGASGSSFTQGSTTSTAYATSVAVSLSASVGVSTDALFGSAFAAQAKVTLSGEVERTTGVEQVARVFTTYGSSHDVHSIVFQGTLHVAYVYEVVSAADPAAVGTLLSINVPVATNEWKWPLDFYNQVFPGAPIRPAEVFAHLAGATVIGDPAAYVSEAELVGLVQGPAPAYDGWVGGQATVGLGGAYNGFGLSLATVNTTTEQLTLSVEASTEFSVPGAMFGASVGLSSALAYTITTSTDTEYAATIGDIANNGVDYPNWNYAAGLVVYQDRTTADMPFQVMRYWVDPIGVGY